MKFIKGSIPIKHKEGCICFRCTRIAWNKGMNSKPNCIDCGTKLSNFGSKRCRSCNSYFTGNLSHIGNKNNKWKGDNAGYVSKHEWVYRHFGQPSQCEICKTNNLKGKYINWANISGNYLRDRKDWLRLCRKCHNAFDDITNKGWVTKRRQIQL